MTSEALWDLATSHGHEVLTVPLSASSSFTIEDASGCHIFLSSHQDSHSEKEHLAHELGHCEYGGFYNRFSPYDIRAKAEHRADKWAFQRLVPYGSIMQAIASGLTEVWELADFFDVSPAFMARAIAYYKTAIG